jgi:hypothetical protein
MPLTGERQDTARMEESAQHPRRVGRHGLALGAASIFASLASLAAFGLYGDWHWDLVRIEREGAAPPSWLTWQVVDGLKVGSMPLALVAAVLAVMALRKRAWAIGLPAIVLAVVALLTMPLVT